MFAIPIYVLGDMKTFSVFWQWANRAVLLLKNANFLHLSVYRMSCNKDIFILFFSLAAETPNGSRAEKLKILLRSCKQCWGCGSASFCRILNIFHWSGYRSEPSSLSPTLSASLTLYLSTLLPQLVSAFSPFLPHP